jgi:hypothetical protein
MFYNSPRVHAYLGYVSPHDNEGLAKVASRSVRFYLTTIRCPFLLNHNIVPLVTDVGRLTARFGGQTQPVGHVGLAAVSHHHLESPSQGASGLPGGLLPRGAPGGPTKRRFFLSWQPQAPRSPGGTGALRLGGPCVEQHALRCALEPMADITQPLQRQGVLRRSPLGHTR